MEEFTYLASHQADKLDIMGMETQLSLAVVISMYFRYIVTQNPK